MLSQPGEFLSDLRVNVVTPKGVLERVALLGPVRQAVQLEISLTDCRTLGVAAPVRLSGDMQDAADVLLVGPAGIYEAKGSTIVAKNHIHMTPDDAARYGVHDGQAVRVRAQTPRPITFEQVMVRVNSNFALAMHIDFDEANACALQPDSVGILCVGGAPQAPQEPVAAAKPVTKTGKLITEAIAKTLCGQGDVTFRKGVIVTPAARDIFTNAHIAIAYAE
jgi:propanediol utilization protein